MEVNFKLKKFASLLLAVVMMFSFIPLPSAEATTVKPTMQARNTEMQVLVYCNRVDGKAGDTLTWTSSPLGGKAPYTYAFYVYKDNVFVTKRMYTSANSYSYTPTSAGNYKVMAFIKDATGIIRYVYSKGVPITGYPTLAATVAENKTFATVGESIVWTTYPSGGKAPYQYAYYVFQDNVIKTKTSYTFTNNYSYTPIEAGNYRVTAYVKDSLGKIASVTSPWIPVTSVNVDPLDITQITANKTGTSIVGDPLVWTTYAIGGKTPYQYKYEVYKNNVLLTTQDYTTNASYSYTPTEVGIYKIIAFVKDSNDTVNFRSSDDISVLSNPLALNVQSDKIALKNNEKVTFYANAYGGTAPYQFTYYLYLDGVLQLTVPYSSNSSYVYSPTVVGTYKMKVSVRDSLGKVVTEESFEVLVTAYVPPRIVSLVQNIAQPNVGDEVVWGVTAADGSVPYSYAWYLYKDGVRIATTQYSTTRSYKYTPTAIGEYYVVAFVKDKNGYVASKASTKFTATSIPLELTAVKASTATSPINSTITWTSTAVGGRKPLQYSFYLFFNDNRIIRTPYSTSNQYSYYAYAAGNYHVMAFVRDASGQTKYAYSDPTVVTATSSLGIKLVASNATPKLGNTVKYTATASAGVAPYTYAFYVYNSSNVLVKKVFYTTSNSLTYTFAAPSTYKVVAFAKDRTGAIKTAEIANIKVDALPLTNNTTLNKTNTTVGGSAIATVKASGGYTPYTYAFYVKKGSTVVHKGSYSTVPTFEYKFASNGEYTIESFVKDKTGKIVVASNNVSVASLQPLQVEIAPSVTNVIVGNNVRWTANVTGGLSPYTYQYRLFKDGKLISTSKVTTNAFYDYKPMYVGKYDVTVVVKDSIGTSNTMETTETVVASPLAPLSFKVSKYSAETPSKPGYAISWKAYDQAGGMPPYTYAFYLFRNDARIKTTAYSTTASYTYTPMQSGSYHVVVFMKDKHGTVLTVKSPIVEVVNPDTSPLVIDSLTANITSGRVGDKIFWNMKASGGTQPYTYSYYLFLDGKRIEVRNYSSATGFTHQAMAPGKYKVTGFVRDANGKVVSQDSSGYITIIEPVITPTEIAIVISKFTPGGVVNQPISWTVSATGGTGTYTYAYYVFKDGIVHSKTGYSTNTSYTFVPTAAGSYGVRVFVKDSNGTIKEKMSPVIVVTQ